MPLPVVIHWFRRDLRLTDNPALHAAAAAAAQVVPVYALSSWRGQHGWTGPIRQQFLCGSLASLAANLQVIGSRLIVRSGSADEVLEKLVIESGAQAIFFNRDYDPYGRAMEQKVQSLCDRLGIECRSFQDRVMHEPDQILTGDGNPYRVYTPYSRNWLAQEKAKPLPAVKSLGPAPAETISSEAPPTLKHWGLPSAPEGVPEAGERAARARMKHLIESGILFQYKEMRDLPEGQTTSHLGADLRFGLIGIRELVARCLAAEANVGASEVVSVHTFIKELAWREFYLAILWHYPEVFEQEFNPDWRGMPWPGTEEGFAAWCQGRTGFPIVDAGIRQMLATGFMHNRVRMIVAMFLTKDLHCDWRWGERFFMQHLVDGENASNNGGWQWSAGTGADAAPYFRIQNPWTQTKRYDSLGRYIKTWVPELRDVPPDAVLGPPENGRPIAAGYPLPIVDHSTERDRTLALFAQHKQSRL